MRNLTLLLVFTLILSQNTYAKELAGEVVSVSGVSFIRPEKSTTPLPKAPTQIKPGDNVFAGDVINTSSEGAVKILMRDKTIVDVGASSLFKVDEYIHNHGSDRKAKLDLMFGKLRVAVTNKIQGNGKFQVKTKGATMGVRGTEFIVKEDVPERLGNSDPHKTEITVVQGKVDVTTAPVPKSEIQEKAVAAKKVSLTAGTQITTGVGVPDMKAPVKLSEPQLQNLAVETKISDNTFAKAITIEPINSKESAGGRSPSSEGASGANGEYAGVNLPPMISKLPDIFVPVGPLDVPGVPRDPFHQNLNVNTMRRLHVSIVTAGP